MVEHAVEGFLRSVVPDATRIAVAVSGGPDSTALVHALHSTVGARIEISALHVNHGLRGAESGDDERWIIELCRSLGVPLLVVRGDLDERDVKRLGVEAAARRVRYHLLESSVPEGAGCYIATAHHRNDQAETLLLRLVSGRGAWRLTGIRPKLGRVIRPFLGCDRAAILEYLGDRGIVYREDSSNVSPRFLRNRIRHEVLPLLREINPAVVDHLAETARLEQDREAAIDEILAPLRCLVERSSSLSRIPSNASGLPHLRRLLLHEEILRLDPAARYASAGMLRRLASLFDAPGRLRPSRLLEVHRSGDWIVLRRIAIVREIRYEHAIEPGEEIVIPEAGWRIRLSRLAAAPEKLVSADRLTQVLGLPGNASRRFTVRSRRNGDRFKPLGMQVEKKLSAFFIDRKIAREDRDSTPLLTHEGRIVWVTGVELSDDFRIGRGESQWFEVRAERIGEAR